MAAIAYVSDNNMLQYHRVNGSSSMVFWRLSAKSFSSFNEGDLLFFLSVDDQTRRKEKGIVGCAKFIFSSACSLDTLWNKYGTLTGYLNKKELITAIYKKSKNKEKISKINYLYLEEVVFFSNSIYLSQFNIRISNLLESFTYLDKQDPEITIKLLQEIALTGPDRWGLLTNNEIDEEEFQTRILIYQIEFLLTKYQTTSKLSQNTVDQIYQSITIKSKRWLDEKKACFYAKDNNNHLFIMYDVQSNDFYQLLGFIIHLKNVIKEQVIVTVITIKEITSNQEKTLTVNNINHLLINES